MDYENLDIKDLLSQMDRNGMVDLGTDETGKVMKAALVHSVETKTSVSKGIIEGLAKNATPQDVPHILERLLSIHSPAVDARIERFISLTKRDEVSAVDGDLFLTNVRHVFGGDPWFDEDFCIATGFYIEENVIVRHTGLFLMSEADEFNQIHKSKLVAMGFEVSDPRLTLPDERRN